MTSKERAEKFVRRVLVTDLKQQVSHRTIRDVAKQVLAVTAPVPARAAKAKNDRAAEAKVA
jgi:hypothetical protein